MQSRSLRVCAVSPWALLAFACSGPTDVVAVVEDVPPSDIEAPVTEFTELPVAEAPVTEPPDTAPSVTPPSAALGTEGAGPDVPGLPMGEMGPPSDVASRGNDQDGARFDSWRSDVFYARPDDWDVSEDELAWVRGWPEPDWQGMTEAWPLETGLPDFFDSSDPDVQVAVWVTGETAEALAEWWDSVTEADRDVVRVEEARFVVAEDADGVRYAVSADWPSAGMSAVLPIPEGFGRGGPP